MRGLILHDIILLKIAWFLIAAFYIAGTFLIFFEFNLNPYNGSVAFLNVMTFLIITSLSSMIITVGDRNNGWYVYAFSTPAAGRGYLKAKYLIILILIGMQYLYFILLYFIINIKYNILFNFSVVLLIMLFGILIFSVIYPMTFGKRYKILPVFVFMPILIAESMLTADVFEIGSEVFADNYKLSIAKSLSEINPFILFSVVVVVVCMVFLSYIISVKNINKCMKGNF